MKIGHKPKLGQKPIRIYAEMGAVEGGALSQFYDAMKQDFAVQGALMPDTHQGYSLPIGAVVATDGYIVPAWVGYDIGCGMCAMPLNIPKELVVNNAQAILDQVYRDIPVGFNVNEGASGATKLRIADLSADGRAIAESKKYERALGSLGGGNHFIEVGADENDRVWIVIHSGSRGVGHGIATHYMKLAANSPKPLEGHYGFRTDSDAGQAYINDMNWALDFAVDNRREMIRRVVRAIEKVVNHGDFDDYVHRDFDSELINRNHNHATEREIDGRTVWIHRKGATHAEKGMGGVIPGNRIDGSFIVEGMGNPDSLYSSSHGAGRVLSRRKAKETLDPELERLRLEEAGVVAHAEKGLLDESKLAYKDIFEVMKMQKDLVTIKAHVKPILNVKG